MRKIHLKVLFLFLCVLLGYFQSHDKHCRNLFSKLSQHKAFIWRFWSRLCRKRFSFKRDPALLGRIKNVRASFKRNIALIKKCLRAQHPVCRPVPFFIPSNFHKTSPQKRIQFSENLKIGCSILHSVPSLPSKNISLAITLIYDKHQLLQFPQKTLFYLIL